MTSSLPLPNKLFFPFSYSRISLPLLLCCIIHSHCNWGNSIFIAATNWLPYTAFRFNSITLLRQVPLSNFIPRPFEILDHLVWHITCQIFCIQICVQLLQRNTALVMFVSQTSLLHPSDHLRFQCAQPNWKVHIQALAFSMDVLLLLSYRVISQH